MSKLENQENGEPKKGKPRGTPFQKGNKFGCGSKQKKENLSLPSYIKRRTNQGELAQEFDGKVKFAKVDIDVEENKDLAVKYGVMSVPTLIIFSNGEVKETLVGVTSKSKLQQKLEDLL